MKFTFNLADIKKAQKNIKGIVKQTELIYDYIASRKYGGEVYCKLENTQIVRSFKIRGALNALKQLTPKQAKAGVIAASAGNHAQGVAYSATQLGIKSIIVMPNSAPAAKIKATLRFGAEVVFGPTPLFDDANKLSQDLAKKNGYTLIPPYDDAAVMAGQGTIGLELLKENPKLDMVIVQIGGGGLISGVATAIKTLKPSCEVIGVQTENFPYAYDAYTNAVLKTPTRGVPTIADGIQVKQPSATAIEIMKKYVSRVVTVKEHEIRRAIAWLAEKDKTIAEGAGATGMAAILSRKIDITGRNVAVIVSGGNIDIDKFIAVCTESLNETNQRKAFKLLYDHKTYKLIFPILQKISGRIYYLNGTKTLKVKDRLEKGWNELSVFTTSAKHTKLFFEMLKQNNIKFKLL
ncbi:threonine dehydratase [Bacilli bacterium]|nr:threonine dehydratase [Bacilli bacterium]